VVRRVLDRNFAGSWGEGGWIELGAVVYCMVAMLTGLFYYSVDRDKRKTRLHQGGQGALHSLQNQSLMGQ